MNIAVAGSGYWGKNIVRNYFELGFLYAVCELNNETRIEIKEKYPEIKIYSDFKDMLLDKNISGIVIATPANTHFDLAKRSLKAGYPTFVEKPLTLNLKDAEELTELAKLTQLPLMVGHILEYHPALVEMKQLIDNDLIGKIKHIRCSRINLGKIRSHENIWWSFAPHDLSIIFMLLDKEPIEINCSSFKPLQNGIEDTVYADLIFEDGVSAHIHVSWLEPIKLHQTIVIGEQGIIVFNDTLKEDKLMLYKYKYDESTPELTKEYANPVYFKDDQPLKLECLHFIDCIKNNKIPKTDANSACRIIKVLEYVDKKLKRDLYYE